MINLKEIARITGYDVSTISRALNNSNRVKEKTRLYIQEVARNYNYLPDARARSLVTGKSKQAGLIIPELISNFFADMVTGIESVLDKAGYSIIITKSGFNENDVNENLNTLISRRIDGLIMDASVFGFDKLAINRLNIPVVYVDVIKDAMPVDFSEVLADNPSSSFIITDVNAFDDIAEYLIGLGHERIGFISDLYTGHRLKSLRRALLKHGVELPDNYVSTGAERYERGGYLRMSKLLSLPALPTAVVAGTDNIAVGAMRVIREHGLRIPEDISIIGYDNLPIGNYVCPSLTSVSQSTQQMGKLAAESLLRKINSDTLAQETHILSTKLVVKESTGPAKCGQL